jgi:hypothetical protein
MFLCIVEGGHRAIIFNRIGGVDQNTIYSEGLHFRYEEAFYSFE